MVAKSAPTAGHYTGRGEIDYIISVTHVYRHSRSKGRGQDLALEYCDCSYNK